MISSPGSPPGRQAGRDWPSIRLRLALLYALVFGSGLLAADLLAYSSLSAFVAARVDDELALQAREVRASTSVEVRLGLAGPGLTVRLPDLDVFASPGLAVQALGRGGEVEARSTNLPESLPANPALLQRALAGEVQFETVRLRGAPWRLAYAPLPFGGEVLGVLQVGRSLEQTETFLDRLRLTMLGAGLVALALATAGGWLLAGAAFRPIDRLVETARAIGQARDFARRVPAPAARDEVGRLAETFNEMLAELESAHAELKSALDAQQRFVADASHELRTPLTTVRTNLELLGRGPDLPAAERDEALADALAEIERLGRLVEGLLTLARADAGQHLRLAELDLAPILRDAYRQARLLALPGEQRVSLGAVPEARVMGSADALRQLLLILLENAVKYSPPSAEVCLECCLEDDLVAISVRDRGAGISTDELPHVFERFYRGDRARSSSGTGLGLAIAKWIVDEHRGRIEVQSAPGHGTTVTVTLPRHPAISYLSLIFF